MLSSMLYNDYAKKRFSVAVCCATIAVTLITSTNKKGHIALCLCIGLCNKVLSASQLESPHVMIFFVKISLHSIVPKNHYMALALCNAYQVCLLGNTTWYAKSHAT